MRGVIQHPVVRKRAAQAAMVVAGAAMFIPWERTTEASGGVAETLNGFAAGEGSIIVIVCLITVALVEIGWRPAWIGAGFVLAICARGMVQITGAMHSEFGSGIWLATAASITAAGLLIWDMFAGISRPDTGS